MSYATSFYLTGAEIGLSLAALALLLVAAWTGKDRVFIGARTGKDRVLVGACAGKDRVLVGAGV